MYLSKATLSQDFDKPKILKGHPLDLWGVVTFNLSVLLAFAPSLAAANSASSSPMVARCRGNGGSESDWMLLVFWAAVVKG